MRQQEIGESVDSFYTALHCLAEHCGYGALHDEMVRDRLVVGLRDKKLSEQLQLDSKLTMDTAISKARQSESVKKQLAMLNTNFKNRSLQYSSGQCAGPGTRCQSHRLQEEAAREQTDAT